MGLTDLPEEMLEAIVQYLSLEDICSCSKVSIQWRIAFNTDRIWKRFDSSNPWFFEKKSSKLNYKPDDGTPEECDIKKRVLKVKFVEENMFNGNYIVSEVDLGSLYCDCVMDFVDNIGNHWLFVSCMEGNMFKGEHRILVWNLNEKPIFHTWKFTPIDGANRLIDSQMNVIEETFYLITGNTLLLYKFAYPLYDLEYMQTFSLAPLTVYVGPYESSSIIRCVGNTIVNFFRTPIHVFNKLPPSFIAWNHKSSVLLKDKIDIHELPNLYPFFCSAFYFAVEASLFEKVFVPVAYLSIEDDTEMLSVQIFDVELLCYTDFYLKREVKYGLYKFSLHKSTLCVMYFDSNRKLTAECHNIKDKNILFNVCFSTGRTYYCHKFISEAELIIFENKVVHLFDILKKKEINSFVIQGRDFGALTILNNSLILLERVTRTVSQEIWNVRTGQIVYEINFSMTLGVQQFRHSHSFNCPPTIVMFKDPQMSYAHLNVKKNLVYIISFW